MTHLEYSEDLQSWATTEPFSTLQKTVTTILVLILACYAWPWLTQNTSVKRSLYELGLWLIPSRFIHVMRNLSQRSLGANVGLTSDRSVLDNKANGDTLQQIYQSSGLPRVLHRARSLSGYTSKPPVIEGVTFAGLGNWDNSCYQNSILQGLASLPAFVDYVQISQRLCALAGIDGRTHESLSELMAQLLQELDARSHLWTPSILKSMDSWQQQDAQEYFSRIQDMLEKEDTRTQKCLVKKRAPALESLRSTVENMDDTSFATRRNSRTSKSSPYSPPTNPLDGLTAQTLRCERCGYSEGITFTSFNCLTLNLSSDESCHIEDMLDAYTSPELIDGVECEECCNRLAAAQGRDENQPSHNEPQRENVASSGKRSRVLTTKSKQITFGRLPENLVIHVNRSIFDNWGNQRKNTSFVTFPSILSIDNQWITSLQAEPLSENPTYELKCIVTHHGRHDNGHYVAFAKRGKDWYSFNDEIVTKVSQEAVLQRGNVFILFYERLLPSTVPGPTSAPAPTIAEVIIPSTISPPLTPEQNDKVVDLGGKSDTQQAIGTVDEQA